jgi:hypothetical protein
MTKGEAPREAQYTDWYGLAMYEPMDQMADVEVRIQAFLGR